MLSALSEQCTGVLQSELHVISQVAAKNERGDNGDRPVTKQSAARFSDDSKTKQVFL